ncbi:hypothetical protein M413DRAFT_30986 [Hebeloma cylindrosporum]|uniref:F-box domain-containing protein n=1 Tax=Hebeloma cylindrosporum TaxID=76867 RepID=A0A0C2XHB8_HEBCY|nr:hypothetical protein M413DRAFT_30986 [Hebeloma cylindrosporum h7]
MIQPSTKRSLAESLPDLLREWLSRSGVRPLTIFFSHFGCSDSEESDDDFSESTVKALELTTKFIIEVPNLHSDRWKNLHLFVGGDILERLCGSTQPMQLFCLELANSGIRLPSQKFVMKSTPSPKRLMLRDFSLTSIDIGWDNVTYADLRLLRQSDWLEILRRAPALEYCLITSWDIITIRFDTHILHSRLRSLDYSSKTTGFLEAINVPSLEEWTHNALCSPLPVSIMVSLLERSGCHLKILNLYDLLHPFTDLRIFLQAVASLEQLKIEICPMQTEERDDGNMDDILTHIFFSPSDINFIPPEETTRELFLPRLQVLELYSRVIPKFSPFSWDRIPQLYRQGRRRSLTLKSVAYPSHMNDEVAHQLVELADEGVDLRIRDGTAKTGGDFLEHFRKKGCKLSSTDSSRRD